MSNKNKPLNKESRRQKRFNTDGSSHPRTPMSEPVPAAIATKILTNPRYKVNSRIRRKLAARRDVVLEIPRQEPKHPAVKLALRLTKLSLEKLHRLLAKSARKSATCKHLIAELSPGSQFAAGIAAEQTHQLGVMKQVSAEIRSRQ